MEEVVALAKRRGFVFPSSLIYGGLANTWDFGHYGTLLKNNVRDWWWKRFVTGRDDMVGIDVSVFMSPRVWDASGHVKNFTDAMVDCKSCHFRTRADYLIEDALPDVKVEGYSPEKLTEMIEKNKIKCPKCGTCDWTTVRRFNLLFETSIGIIEDSKAKMYLRGEIAQGIFVNFKNVLDSMRVRIPFGIAQYGKAYRNEITLGQFLHRTLEMDLMEFEYFIRPESWEKYYSFWHQEMEKWAKDMGITEKKLRWREHTPEEKAHYSQKTMDLEYEYSFGWKEMFGLAYRTDFDLQNHSRHSGTDLSYRDPKSGEKFIPHVIEPSFGLSRLIGILLTDAYREDEVGGKKRTYLKLHPLIAPVKAAVFPLQKDEKLRFTARSLYEDLQKEWVCEFDDAGNIGKMYRRQDEIGTPFCITVDYQTGEDNSVTVRHRDDMKQERIPIPNVKKYIMEGVGRYY